MDDWHDSDSPEPPALEHSGPGVASFVTALVAGTLVFVCIIVAGIVEASDPGALHDESPLAVVLGLGIIFSLVVCFAGVALAIAGLMQDKRNKVFAVIGLVFNGLILAGAALIILMALLLG